MLPVKWGTGLQFKSGPDNGTTHQKVWDKIQRLSKKGINCTKARLEWLIQLFSSCFLIMSGWWESKVCTNLHPTDGKKQVSFRDIYRNFINRKTQNNGCWLGQRWLSRKEGQVLQTVLTVFHTAAKKEMERHEIKTTTHEIMEEVFLLHEKLIHSILGQETIVLQGVSFYHKVPKGGLSLDSTQKTLNSRNLHCPFSGQAYGSQSHKHPAGITLKCSTIFSIFLDLL